MKYNTCSPYFPPRDIRSILSEFRDILEGNGVLTMGRHVREFESKFAVYTGARYAVAVNSCTSGLEIALRSLDIGKGDEVIVPVQTFIATGSCVLTAGAKVVFCDVDSSFLIDFADLRKKVTARTRAVIVVHFAGLIHPEIFKIRRFLKEKKVYLIEDAAHACGAKIGGNHAGALGDIGCFSFYSTKIMTTGEGGMITVNDKILYELCGSMRNRGLDLNAGQEQYSLLGGNRRMSEVQGIMGCHQLKRLDEFVRHRNRIAAIYRDELRDSADAGVISFQEYPAKITHAYWRFVVFLKRAKINRDALKRSLFIKGIGIDWPYKPLLHLQPVFKSLYGAREGDFAKSEALAERHFCLPVHNGIKPRDAVFIAGALKGVLNG